MNFRDAPGIEGSDLPEFDPDELDSFPRAIAEMQQSETLDTILKRAIEQDEFVLKPDDIPLNCNLIYALSVLHPTLPLKQLQQNIYHSLIVLFLEYKSEIHELRFQRKELEKLSQRNQRLKDKIRKENLHFRLLWLSKVSLVLSLSIVVGLVGVFLFQGIQIHSNDRDRQNQQELTDFKQHFE